MHQRRKEQLGAQMAKESRKSSFKDRASMMVCCYPCRATEKKIIIKKGIQVELA